jgi:manganese transport protein
MGNIFEVFLGIVSATGGFIDIGELVFLTQAGAKFFYSLIWVVILGTAGIIVYSEMSGRVAAVSKKAIFDLVPVKLGIPVGSIALIAAFLVTLVTCAAEIGGMALIIQMLTHWSFYISVGISFVVLIAVVWISPFSVLEKGLGAFGLLMLIFVVIVFAVNTPWSAIAHGLLPPTSLTPAQLLLYAYFVVGILASVMMPYEIIFYSSGAIEDKWTLKELSLNRIITGIGFSFGSIVALALLINAASLLAPRGIDPQLLGATALQAIIPFGLWGFYIAIIGMWFAIMGAAVETCLSGAYMVCQFFSKPWGKSAHARDVPIFYAIWITVACCAALIALFGPEPMQIAEYAVVFSTLALPLTYLTVLLAGNDMQLMGAHTNGVLSRTFGIVFLVIVTIVAIAAIPLLIATSMGNIW